MMAIPAHLVIAVFAASSAYAATTGAKRSSSSLIPYFPTTILIPGSTTGTVDTTDANENSTAYIFTSNDSGDSVALLSVDITSTLNASSISSAAKTLTSSLPFASSLSSSNTSTFVPTLALDGSILVYSGDCTSDTGSQVWIYNTSTSDSASWTRYSVSSSSDNATGPYFLGGGLAFSDIIAPSLSSPSIYAYGGQCPNASLVDDGDDADAWVSAAEYTNTMVKLNPSPSSSSFSSSSDQSYDPETLSLRLQPIAEAGFSFTSLRPSTSNISGTVTQNINAVVLGGHTRTAFVNMSTAAVWSLPEETWSFVSISGPSSSSSSDTNELAKNDGYGARVTERSGHTAVLNEEGTALIVLGGWVGNTSEAATPQLAVLQMNGSEYGEWTWTVPENQPLSNGEGIYSHGAALLPGNIMMVSGGQSISSSSSSPSSSSKLRARADISAAGGQLKSFLNITSMTWTDSYTNPSSSSSTSSTAPSSAGSTTSTNTTRLGLGLGLGLGIPFLLLLLVAAIVYCIRRRRRYRHAVRDEHMRNLTSGHAFITSEEMLERQHESSSLWGSSLAGAAGWYYTGGHDPYLRDEKSLGYESLRGSRSGGPLPQQGGDFEEPMAVEPVAGYKTTLRRKPVPRVAKGLYQPTGVDENRALGAIHPILEDEEDEISMHGAMSPDREFEGVGEDDPFMTPATSPDREQGRNSIHSTHMLRGDSPGASSPIEPRTPIRPQHPEVQDWVTDIDASDALITARIQRRSTTTTIGRNAGRATPPPPPPTRRQSLREDDGGARTDSNLSESNRSAFSFMPSRADSLRVAATGAAAAAAAASAVGSALPAWLTTATSAQEKRGGTSHSDHSSNSNSNSNTSYTTAKSISALQAEGPTLLLGRPRAISDIYNVADDDPLAGEPGSPSKSKPPRRSWFGSLRRVFSNGHSSDSSSGGNSVRTESPVAQGETSDYDRLGLGSLGLGRIGLLQKRRQGRSAWDTTTGQAGAGQYGDAPRGSGEQGWEQEEEEDWDIEKAVEQRLVQVMFSVPKERLRIVNGDPEILSLAESAVVVDLDADAAAGIHTHNNNNNLDEDPLSPIQESEKTPDKGKQVMDAIPIRFLEESPLPLLEKKEEEEMTTTTTTNKNNKNSKEKEVEKGQADTSAERELVTPSPKRPALLLKVPPSDANSEVSTGSPVRRGWTPSPGVPMTAEEVRYERPKSRVLAMVEQFEGRSRSNSPSPSPSLSPAKSFGSLHT